MILAARDGFVFGHKARINTLPTILAYILPMHVCNTLLQAWQKPVLKKGVTGLTSCPTIVCHKADILPALRLIPWLPSSLMRSGRR